ncbi:hypothetical protein ACYCS5_10920 [Paenibacillus sp. SEL3]
MIVTNAKHRFAAGLPWRNISLLEKKNLDQDNTPTIPRTDYVANPNAKTYAVAVDPSDAHLAHLKKLGISYIFGGKESLNFTVEG